MDSRAATYSPYGPDLFGLNGPILGGTRGSLFRDMPRPMGSDYGERGYEDKYHEAYASITTLKQMRSSTGQQRSHSSLSLQFPPMKSRLGPVGSRTSGSQSPSPGDTPPTTPGGMYSFPPGYGVRTNLHPADYRGYNPSARDMFSFPEYQGA
eukprot:maker-scaffold295_size218279-snap-gene-1.28 protein:Tk09096 transcript:maker-scaffold295_size218279-snap-gene-1.28-mRNA-1 annotation:"exopolysaccharide biosynthesis protein"